MEGTYQVVGKRRELCTGWTGWKGAYHFKQDDQQAVGEQPQGAEACQSPAASASLRAREVASVGRRQEGGAGVKHKDERGLGATGETDQGPDTTG